MKPQTIPPDPAVMYRKHRNLQTANGFIGGFGCLPAAVFSISVIGISLKLGLPALLLCFFVIPRCFRLYAGTGKHKPLLLVMRGIFIGLVAVILSAVTVCLEFERKPLFYQAKLRVFSHGVRSSAAQQSLLPETLPAVCEDYYFRTEPCMIAQDYTPCAYLFLHTDAAALEQYAAKLDSFEGVRRIETKPPEDYEPAPDLPYRPAELPGFVYYQLTDPHRAGFTDDLSHAVVYYPSERAGQWYAGSGALINYETGLLAVWL